MESSLQHHGIKGQKWGRRRFQNKDGTLTPAGKKRYDNEYMQLKQEKKVLTNKKKTAAKLQKLDDMRKANDELRKEIKGGSKEKKSGKTESTENRPTGIKDLSTEELRARTDRMRAEKDYISAQMELSRLQPEKVSAGRKFAEKLIKDTIVPAAVDIGKKSAEGYLKKKLGLNDSTADALKKESERLKREADDWGNKQRADQAKEYFKQKEKKAETEAKNNKTTKDDEPETVKTSGKDVSGEGTSKFTGFDSNRPPRDVVWDGQKYVEELLGLPDPDRRKKR